MCISCKRKSPNSSRTLPRIKVLFLLTWLYLITYWDHANACRKLSIKVSVLKICKKVWKILTFRSAKPNANLNFEGWVFMCFHQETHWNNIFQEHKKQNALWIKNLTNKMDINKNKKLVTTYFCNILCLICWQTFITSLSLRGFSSILAAK